MSYEEKDGWNCCLFPARGCSYTFDTTFLDSTSLYLYLDMACKQLCFPPRRGINERIESTISELFRAPQCLSEFFRTFFNISEQLLLFCSTDDI